MLARVGDKKKHGRTGSGGHGLEPSAPLTVAEAARLAGVPSEVIEARMGDGALLFETGKVAGKEARIIRFMDLAELFPGLAPKPKPVAEQAAPASSPAENDPESDPVLDTAATPDPVRAVTDPSGSENDLMASAVRASGTDRNALIELCQDLETRLDLAERERQASTASLLMAQRRVLDLERSEGRRPMTWAAAASLGVCGVALVALAVRLPATVRAAAREEIQSVQAEFETRSATLQKSLDASMLSLSTSMAKAMETARVEERALLQGEREAQAAQIAALEARLAEARRLQAAEAEALTEKVTSAVAERSLQDTAERKNANDALEARLQAAEALGQTARDALAEERVQGDADREAFREELRAALEHHDNALKATLERLESAAAQADAETTAADAAAAEGPPEKKAPTPWWKRALGDLRD